MSYITFADLTGSYDEVADRVKRILGTGFMVRRDGFTRYGQAIHRVYLESQELYERLTEQTINWFNGSQPVQKVQPSAVYITVQAGRDASLITGLIARTLRLHGYAVDLQMAPDANLYDQHPVEDLRSTQIYLDTFPDPQRIDETVFLARQVEDFEEKTDIAA